MTYEELNKIFQKYLGRDIAQPDWQGSEEARQSAFRLATQTPEQVAREVLASPEYMTRQETLAKQPYLPRLEEIELTEKQARKEAEISGQRLGFKKQELAGTKTTIEEDIADAIKKVKKHEEEQNISFLNRQQRLGLRPSGLTVGGLQELATTTGETLNRLERDRANKLALVALQENELTLSGQEAENTLQSAIRLAQIQKGAVSQDVSERKKQLIDTAASELEQAVREGDAEAFNRAIKMIDLAQETPEGQTIDLGKFGKITGVKKATPRERKTEQATVDGRRVLIDSDTGEVIKDLGSAYKATVGDGVSDVSGVSTETAAIKAIKSAVKAGGNVLDIGEQIYNSPLDNTEKMRIFSWFFKTYNVNINSPLGRKVLKLERTGGKGAKGGSFVGAEEDEDY